MIPALNLRRACMAEIIGTYILVFFGIGSVHAAVLTGAQAGIWQVAIVWGVAISLGIYATGAISGAHMNPAITLAFTAFRRFPSRHVPAYVASQLLGAILAAATLYMLFSGVLHQFEAANGIVRGQPGSELSAMVYGEYFPNPAIAKAMKWSDGSVSHVQAMLAEGIGTAFLAFFIFAITEPLNTGSPGSKLRPVFIGLTVSILISVLAPLTQAGFNPARDFGPRLFAYIAGWGTVAIPGPHGGFLTVYILSPIIGAISGAGAYEYLMKPGLKARGSLEKAENASQIRGTTMKPTRLILVGGFLGAGKTTLLWEAARRLAARGERVGLITNDQAPDLVDTSLLARQGFDVREVAGSCFCCNFNALIDAAAGLQKDIQADVLIGEPVGSCTDLSATILQPLKDRYRQEFVLTPLSVLADPSRVLEVLTGDAAGLHPDAAYIYRKQLEEADVIVVNKVDLLSSAQRVELREILTDQFPGRSLRFISAQTGEGVDEWLDDILAGGTAGTRITEVDYDRYARGEAVLGWLNATCDLTAASGTVDWDDFCHQLLESFKEEFARQAAPVGHVKIILSTAHGTCAGNLTRTDAEVSVRNRLTGRSPAARLVVNARVEMSPESLEGIVRGTLQQGVNDQVVARIDHLRSLSPGRPVPTHRYVNIV
jgi:glycerol uptake facilitator protein